MAEEEEQVDYKCCGFEKKISLTTAAILELVKVACGILFMVLATTGSIACLYFGSQDIIEATEPYEIVYGTGLIINGIPFLIGLVILSLFIATNREFESKKVKIISWCLMVLQAIGIFLAALGRFGHNHQLRMKEQQLIT